MLLLTIFFVLVAVILDATYHEKNYAVENHPIYQSEKTIIQFGGELESESNYCRANFWKNSEIYRLTEPFLHATDEPKPFDRLEISSTASIVLGLVYGLILVPLFFELYRKMTLTQHIWFA